MQPAAVLSIMVKAQGVQTASTQLGALDKNARKAGTGLSTTEKHAKRTGVAFASLGKAAGLAGVAVGVAGLAAGLKLANSEYREAQKVGAQTTAVLKSTGGAAKVTKKHIEDLSTAISKKAGIDDEAIQTGANLLLTFRGIRNEQGKGNKIFDQATQVITDMSVSMKQGLKPSAIQVGKALNDPVKGLTALGRVGVTFTEGQKKQVAALVASGDKLAAQKIILKELKSEFAGSAAAQATAGDKLKVAWGNLAEAAGGILVPALDKVATFFTKVINQFVAGEGIAKFIIPVFTGIRDAVQTIATNPAVIKFFTDFKDAMVILFNTVAPFVATTAPKLVAFFQTLPGPVQTALAAFGGFLVLFAVGGPLMVGIAAFAVAAVLIKRNWSSISGVISGVRDSISGWVTKNQADIAIVIKAFHDVASVVAAVFKVAFPVAIAVAKRTLDGLKTATSGALQLVHGVITTFLALLHGDWSRAWGGLKDIAVGALRTAYGAVKAATAPFREIGSRIIDAVKDGLSMLGHEILNRFKDAANFVISNVSGLFKGVGSKIASGVGKINPFGDGIGKGGGAAGKGSAALMGANSSLGPFAAAGARFGLSVSSGRRPGAITSSGNVSYHSTGEAIDEAGSPAGMMAFFKFMKGTYGSRLAELIYGPGKVGIKDGQPYNFGSALNAQHMDHVHVALDTGKPGPGDGIGRMSKAGKFMGDGGGFLPGFGSFNYSYGAFVKYMAKPRSLGGQYLAHGIPLGSIGRGISPAQMYLAADQYFGVGRGGRKSRPPVEYKYIDKFQKGQKGDGIGKRMRAAFTGDGYGKTALQTLWKRAGGPAGAANIASAVALAESGGRSTATHRNTDGSIDRGLWQINSTHGALSTLNPLANARAAVSISARGKNWNPWTTYTSGAYKRFLGKQTAAQKKAASKAPRTDPKAASKAHAIHSKIAGPASQAVQDAMTQQRLDEQDHAAQIASQIQDEQNRGAGGAGDDGGDPNQPLIDALAAQAQALKDQTDALNAVKAEQKRTNDIAAAVTSTSGYQATKFFADLISGHIVGRGVIGRSFTPGTGTEMAY